MILLDSTDNSILEVMKENSRLSSRQIAKKTGISLATVVRRLKKLIDTGIIKRFTVDLDYEKLGRRTSAYIMIRTTPGLDYHDILRECPRYKEVVDIEATAGQFDIVMKVRVKDTDELSDFIFKRVRKFPSVLQTQTLIALKTSKK